MKISYPELAKFQPVIKLRESLVPSKRLELRINMEKHILRFAVMAWNEEGKLTENIEFDSLHIAVDYFNGDMR